MRAPRALVVGLALLSAGCALGPKYNRPAAAVPPAYKEPVPAEIPAEGWKSAEPVDGAPRGKWWEAFGDYELSALENEVDRANQNQGAESTLAMISVLQQGANLRARGFGTPASLTSG